MPNAVPDTVSTSGAPSTLAPDSAPSGDTGSGAAGGTASIEAGGSTDSTTSLKGQEEGTTSTPSASIDTKSVTWDAEAWDGAVDKLPSEYHPVYNRMSALNKSALDEISADRDLYRDVVLGTRADPRVAAIQAELDDYKSKHGSLDGEHKALQKEIISIQNEAKMFRDKYNEIVDQQATQMVEAFKERHKSLLADPVKRGELITLIDDGWEEEAATMLVGMTQAVRDRAKAICAEHNLSGTGHRLAVQQAKNELVGKRPSGSAMLTAGANGAQNPAHVSASGIRDMSATDARFAAARLALVGSKG